MRSSRVALSVTRRWPEGCWCAQPVLVQPAGEAIEPKSSALKAGHLPWEAVMGVGGVEPALGENGQHRLRRMGERSKLLSQEPEHAVLGADRQAPDGVARQAH